MKAFLVGAVVVICQAFLCASASGQANSLFQPPLNLPTGQPTQPISIAIGDFDRSGRPDLAVSNATSEPDSTITVFLNAGLRSFAPPRSFASGPNPRSITTADFDRDGILDLAVPNNGSITVSVLLGDGLGGFETRMAFPGGFDPVGIAAADFNGDGNVDLAASNNYARPSNGGLNLRILLGSGSGSFGPPNGFPAGDHPFTIAVADFNQDTKADLAIANFSGHTVSVHPGDGTGAFPSMTEYPVGRNPIFVATGDLNRDGRLDLAVASTDAGLPIPGSLSVVMGRENGTFAEASFLPFDAGQPNCVAIADLNGDAHLDLAVTRVVPDELLVYLGDGSGRFGAPASYAAGLKPQFVAAADFDRDGRTDLAVANQHSRDVSIFFGSAPAGEALPPVPTLSVPMMIFLGACLAGAALSLLRRG